MLRPLDVPKEFSAVGMTDGGATRLQGAFLDFANLWACDDPNLRAGGYERPTFAGKINKSRYFHA
jgi:hypothetical protein